MATRRALGEQMQAARKNSKQTQAQLSEQTGIHKSTLSAIENGRFTGSLAIYERYIDALGLELLLVPKQRQLPDWDEIETLFGEDE